MRFAAIANAGASHQMAMCAIGRQLQKRGHSFLLVGTQFQAKQLALPDISFQIAGNGRHDPCARYLERTKEEGKVSISSALEYMKAMAALLCEEIPEVLKKNKIDAVLADQEEPGAATAAELAGLPYASICNSLPLNEGPDIPPGFLDWKHAPGLLARTRNRSAYFVRNVLLRDVNKVLNSYRRAADLRPYRKPDDSFSRSAQITQLVREFDFPRAAMPPAFHYVGPFQRRNLSTVEFPYDRLNGSPLIYASFGTIFGSRSGELRAIADACATLRVQLVISLGGVEPASEHGGFAGSPIVVRYAPQRELLSRCAIAITHGGLNTSLEALSFGVPLIALPMAGDQFGVAARIAHHGVGIALPEKRRTPARLREAISFLLENRESSAAAQRLRRAIARTGGADEAAAIIEKIV